MVSNVNESLIKKDWNTSLNFFNESSEKIHKLKLKPNRKRILNDFKFHREYMINWDRNLFKESSLMKSLSIERNVEKSGWLPLYRFVSHLSRSIKRDREHTRRSDLVSYRSSWLIPLWMQILGKLHSVNNLFNSLARLTLRTKMQTWLNSKLSSKSFNLRFFSFSWSFT